MTAVAALQATLDRIAIFSEDYRPYARLDSDGAMRAAAAADAARREGRWLGLLHGMLVAVKDNIDTAGVRTSCGSALFSDRVPAADAPVVERLRRAGAIVVGKAALMELCFGVRSTDMIAGQVRNPWNRLHVPGGSSGGSAAAVALDLCKGALGTDTGGSVRVPAAFCGITGLRPTHGRVPNRGALAVSASFDTIGPMARGVDDVARMFAAIAGFDAEDPTSVDHPLDATILTDAGDVTGLRIGLPANFYFDDIDPEIATAVRNVADALGKAGARIIDITVPDAERAHHYATTIVLADACDVHAEALDTRHNAFSAQVYERMSRGRAFSAVDYAQAERFRAAWRSNLRKLFTQVDVLLFPTTPFTAPLIEDGAHLADATRHATRFAYGGGLAGLPGLSLPCGITKGGLPIGALLEAAWFNEAALLRAGRAWQRITDWHLRRPPIA
jgi:aspartyl-tRNA(Asn)/glutamyl-tRNA(Gln) amidotransferase subunit A